MVPRASATRTIRLAHSPDADDAFMFWALVTGKIDTGDRRYVHELADIESLNRRALGGGTSRSRRCRSTRMHTSPTGTRCWRTARASGTATGRAS